VKKILFVLLTGTMFLGLVGLVKNAEAAPIDYAHLNYGASIYGYSSGLDDPLQAIVPADPRDVIGGSFSQYYSGEVGNFIFDIGDMDQYIIVDLGATRTLDKVGASFSEYPSDREVWDYFEVSIATDITSFSSVGSIGTKGDGIVDVFTSPSFFDLSSPAEARYVMYEFGETTADWGGGSRVLDVYAMGNSVPVPEPATIFLLGGGLLGMLGIKRKNTEEF